MLDTIADLLIDSEAAFFEARSRHILEKSAESRHALREAAQRLEDVKAQAERVLKDCI